VGTSSDTASTLSAAIAAAVHAAWAADSAAFAEASNRLTAQDLERVGIVQAAVLRSLLEELHPDGLDAEDARAVLTRSVQASVWFPDIDSETLLLVVAGALGVLDPEDQPQTGRDRLTTHATALIAELSSTMPARLTTHLDGAIAEIRRAETIEMP
jgi:hypothetical protein